MLVLQTLLVVPCALLALAWALNAAWAYAAALLISLVGWCCCCCSKRDASLKDKLVLITGGSSGIGLAVAKLCAQRGARLLLVARNEAKLAAAKEAILREAPNGGEESVSVLSLDLAAPAETVEAALRAQTQIAAGEVEYAVLSAGDSGPAAFESIHRQDWERLLRLNVLGCVWATRAVFPGMRQRRSGRIVLISSMAGQVGVFGFTAYSASKFALRGFAEALRMEAKPLGVGVTLVVPPDTDTPLLERENVDKPVECKRISEGAGLFSAETVARGTVDGMQRGDGVVHFGLDGWMLSHLTVGMLPADSCAELLSSIFLWPLLRLIGLAHTAYYDHICREEEAKRRRPPAAGGSLAAYGGVVDEAA
jgi:3-dehydrosphinganine reductase